jgi:hypothetical protein
MGDGPHDDDELPLFSPEPAWELPDEARQVLATSLESPDPEVRLEAVEMLAHSLDDGLALRGLEIARSDPEEEIRAAAASALAPALAAVIAARADGDAPAPPLSSEAFEAVRQGLRLLYYDSGSTKEVRRRALESSVQAPDQWLEGATRAAWASDDPEWRTTAVFCMTRLPGFEVELEEALRDRQPGVRLEAARAVGDAGLLGAAPRLLALARAADEEGLVRMAAMESLALLGDRGAIPHLRELAGVADPELAFAARAALARLAEDVEPPADEEDDGPIF